MSEEANLAVVYAFGGLNLYRIEANIMPYNIALLRVEEKCKFENEGLSKNYLHINGNWIQNSRQILVFL